MPHSSSFWRSCVPVIALALATAVGAAEPLHWVVTWGASPSPVLSDAAALAKAHLLFDAQTVTEIVHSSIGGSRVRVRFSNVFGAAPLRIGAASIGLRDGSPLPLTFGGQSRLTIPPNAVAISDPVTLAVPPATDLAIRLYLPSPTTGAGIHYAALQSSTVAAGDEGGARPPGALAAPTTSATTLASWVFLAGVDVEAPLNVGALVAFGDSITDGSHSTANANHRWPDILAQRLLARTDGAPIGVLNAGIGGNRILHDATNPVTFGVSGLARFDRDVLAQPGVSYLILMEGINDIGHPGTNAAPATDGVTTSDLIAGACQIIERAHERGLKVFLATLTPFEGAAYFTPEKAAVRQQFNAWIRTAGRADGVIDFERVIQDPAHPARFRPAFDSGDHLHPNDAGYKAMGEAVDLGLFAANP